MGLLRARRIWGAHAGSFRGRASGRMSRPGGVDAPSPSWLRAPARRPWSGESCASPRGSGVFGREKPAKETEESPRGVNLRRRRGAFPAGRLTHHRKAAWPRGPQPEDGGLWLGVGAARKTAGRPVVPGVASGELGLREARGSGLRTRTIPL